MSLLEIINIKNIDHLGIVAGIIDEIGIVEIINEKVGIDPREKIPSGQVVKAMILNGLGMISSPLYLFSKFFEDKGIDKLLGEGIKAEYLNDDKLGRVMDEMYKLGLSSLFIEIALGVINKFKIETKFSHLDSTSFHLHGEYKREENEEKSEEIMKERPILIKKGYSRDHHPELKQCILDLIVTNDHAIPLFMRAADGNETDVEAFGKIFVEYKKRIQLESIMVADCALYSEKNLKLMQDLKWITRVPAKIKEVKELIETVEISSIEIGENLTEKEQKLRKEFKEKGYRWEEKIVIYKGLKQRWLMIESEARKTSDLKSLLKKIEGEKTKTLKKLEQLEKEEFESETQARRELNLINKKSTFFSLREIEVIELANKKKEKSYKLKLKIEENSEVIERKKRSTGRFILATNILEEKEITSAEILLNYKNQQGCEQGFGFLKDPLFFADSFFVEKEERVETILWLMSLCLLVYNLGQRELRNSLKRTNNVVKNQVGKGINNPTLRWIFQCFQGIHYVTTLEVKQVFNLTKERSFILEFLPSSCLKYYL
jgi:transposase